MLIDSFLYLLDVDRRRRPDRAFPSGPVGDIFGDRRAMRRRFWPNVVPMPLSGVLGRRWRARQDSNLRPSA